MGGQTVNPYGLNRTPCGSSSGSGVAVAVGAIDIAIGTETNGSISCPSSVNGIVGIKIKANNKYLILIYFVDKLESLSFRSFIKIVPKSSKKGTRGKKYLVNLT